MIDTIAFAYFLIAMTLLEALKWPMALLVAFFIVQSFRRRA